MKMSVVIIGLAASFLFAGQTAFAQDTASQKSVSEAHATAKTTKHVTVRKPLSGKNKSLHKVGKTRVIHDVNKARADMNVFRRSVKKTSTPNLYRN